MGASKKVTDNDTKDEKLTNLTRLRLWIQQWRHPVPPLLVVLLTDFRPRRFGSCMQVREREQPSSLAGLRGPQRRIKPMVTVGDGRHRYGGGYT